MENSGNSSASSSPPPAIPVDSEFLGIQLFSGILTCGKNILLHLHQHTQLLMSLT
jgi:hypothetical protein